MRPCVSLERVVAHMGLVAVGRVEPDATDEPHQVHVAALVLRDQHDRGAAEAGEAAGGDVGEIHGELRADQRLHAGLGGLFRKLQRAEQVVGVGDGDGRLLVGLGVLDQRLDGNGALAQRIGAVDMSVNEADGFKNRGVHEAELSAGARAASRLSGRVIPVATRLGRRISRRLGRSAEPR